MRAKKKRRVRVPRARIAKAPLDLVRVERKLTQAQKRDRGRVRARWLAEADEAEGRGHHARARYVREVTGRLLGDG